MWGPTWTGAQQPGSSQKHQACRTQLMEPHYAQSVPAPTACAVSYPPPPYTYPSRCLSHCSCSNSSALDASSVLAWEAGGMAGPQSAKQQLNITCMLKRQINAHHHAASHKFLADFPSLKADMAVGDEQYPAALQGSLVTATGNHVFKLQA